jgi:uncharacterized phiE125 gp8 family phage protein
MTIFPTNPPMAEPITLADAKAHMRIDSDAEDALITGLIRVARVHLEAVTGHALMEQGFRLVLSDWPREHRILIRKAPVMRIDAVTLFDADGMAQETNPLSVGLDMTRRPARLSVRHLGSGPIIDGIEIDFTAGFGASGNDVPDTLRRAMLLHVAQMYEFRGAISLAQQPAAVPQGYERLIAPFMRRGL